VNQFAGLTPYASELFGIYQPILGWKGRQKRIWIDRRRTALLRSAVERLKAIGPSRKSLLANPRLTGPDDVVPREIEAWADTETGRSVRDAAAKFVESQKRLPEASDWPAILKTAALDKVMTRIARQQSAPAGRRGVTGIRREAAVAGALAHLSATAPQALHSVLKLDKALWPLLTAITDPLASFDPTTQRAILSPIGLINVFRQYFFEFDTFLGPAVGHVWVSPGGTLEVYEVHSRRQVEERTVEIGQTVTTKLERESKEDTEISSKVAEKNSQDINLGVSAEGGVNMGVYHASASASFDMGLNQEVAEENAHKHARSQSERVSSEIRREFKTTFKTTLEVSDTSSRRYVLQNTTDKLVNYELRRKMRRVGVQLQHVGTQLCWQVYVDDPGRALGISTLVHASAPEELVSTPPPEAPPALEAKKEQVVVNFPFEPLDEEARDDGEDEEYKDGVEPGNDGEGKIRHIKKVVAQPPANGYTLQAAAVLSHAGTNPEEDPPLKVATECQVLSATEFNVVLKYVDFNNQPSINFTVELLWAPPAESPETKQAYEEAKQKYQEETDKAAHRAYVKEVRERVNQASRIERRPSDELRQEERAVIFRRLIRELTNLPVTLEPHLLSELIRAIFDVDKMLYYVAQEWWRPRAHQPQRLGESTQLTADDKVSWGGDGEFGRPNYLITEESAPAPLGASLGWLIQIDGDNHRNAFLNSPWVKAVLPIRPGREAAAMNWLTQAHVEGAGDLDAKYGGQEPGLAGKTIGEAAMALAQKVSAQESAIESTLSTEKVFENGFDPLEGGFRATGAPFEVFDQWVEVLPTDQVVAVEYQPPPIVPVP
jgi:hypothetical protein